MKKWLFGTLALSLVATSVQADQLQQPYNKIKKQIDIMSNIISTSLSDDSSNRRGRSKVEVDGVYLKYQGIVFEISSGRGLSRLLHSFGNDIRFSLSGDIHGAIPTPPMAPVIIDDDEEGEIRIEIADSMALYEDAMDAFRSKAEHARELREEQRELAYEIRSLARRKRDLEFELRHADTDQMKQLKEQLKELEEEKAKIEKKSTELSARAEKEESTLKAKKSEREQKIKKARTAYFAKLDEVISETLCNYGSGLRQLNKDEHVTFVIDLGAKDESGGSKKIHAFSKKDILACVMEDKTPEQLLKSAQSYYF